MIRSLLLISLFFSVSFSSCASAENPGSQSSQPVAISVDQARAALDVLNDPAKRAAFSDTLTAIINSQSVSAPKSSISSRSPATPASQAAVEGVNIPLAPDSLGAEVLLSASAFLNRVSSQTVEAVEALQSIPLLYGWAVVMTTNPVARQLLADVSWRVALFVVCAAGIQLVLRSVLARPIRRLERINPDTAASAEGQLDAADPNSIARAEVGETEGPARRRSRPSALSFLKRVPAVLARLLLELIPVIGIMFVGHLIAGSSLGGQVASRLIILAVVDSYVVCASLLCVVRMLLSPEASLLRLFHLSDSAALYLTVWARRLILVAVIGYVLGEVGLLLGLSEIAHEAIQKVIGLILHICLAALVIKNRRAVRHWLQAPDGSVGMVASLRNRLARVWHGIVLFFLIAGWLIWAVEVPHGFAAVLHYFVVTCLVLIGARLALLLLLGASDRLLRISTDNEGINFRINARLQAYYPLIAGVIRAAVYVLCGLGLLQLYGLNTFLWLIKSALGLRLLSAALTLLGTIILSLGVWEVVNGGMQQYISRLQQDAQTAKSARLRTLLPLLRTALLIAIAIVAGLMILSEIGINIAPLLAGAGIIGVAIGFGSQKLVQDLITGIFLLLENAMQVGDSVTVSGLSGTVEALSVRTIRLRASDGSVHIIPFSAVTSVTNVNRGIGNATISISVAYDEDTDRVSDEIKGIVGGMRADPDFSAKMLSDFQLWGVDKVDGAAVTVAGQVVCTDAGRWAVQREFNRRMKRRFQELGLKIYNPTHVITLNTVNATVVPKGGSNGHAAISG